MNAISTTLRIDSIIFDNTDTKVLIKGETFKNHLSYMSEMFISFSELNVLINRLQQQNPAFNVSEMFTEEYFGSDFYQTSMEAASLENNLVYMDFLSFKSGKKLIRA